MTQPEEAARGAQGWEGGHIDQVVLLHHGQPVPEGWGIRGGKGGIGGSLARVRPSPKTARRKRSLSSSSPPPLLQLAKPPSHLISFSMLALPATPPRHPPPPSEKQGWWKQAEMHGWELASKKKQTKKRFGVLFCLYARLTLQRVGMAMSGPDGGGVGSGGGWGDRGGGKREEGGRHRQGCNRVLRNSEGRPNITT